MLMGIDGTRKAEQPAATLTQEEHGTQLLMAISAVDNSDAEHAGADAVAESATSKVEPGTIPVEGGGFVRVHYSPQDFKAVYLDEYTREPLPSDLAQAAIKEELEYFNSRVWELSDARFFFFWKSRLQGDTYPLGNLQQGGRWQARYSRAVGCLRDQDFQIRRLFRKYTTA